MLFLSTFQLYKQIMKKKFQLDKIQQSLYQLIPEEERTENGRWQGFFAELQQFKHNKDVFQKDYANLQSSFVKLECQFNQLREACSKDGQRITELSLENMEMKMNMVIERYSYIGFYPSSTSKASVSDIQARLQAARKDCDEQIQKLACLANNTNICMPFYHEIFLTQKLKIEDQISVLKGILAEKKDLKDQIAYVKQTLEDYRTQHKCPYRRELELQEIYARRRRDFDYSQTKTERITISPSEEEINTQLPLKQEDL